MKLKRSEKSFHFRAMRIAGLLLLAAPIHAFAADACFEKVRPLWNQAVAAQKAEYEKRTSRGFGNGIKTPKLVRRVSPKDGVTESRDRLAILIHGFLGSPGELGDLPESFAKAGFDVVTPLVENYGGDRKLLGWATEREQLATLESQLEPFFDCYPEITIVGFSNGASLGSLLAVAHPGRVSAIELVEPAIRPKSLAVLTVGTEILRGLVKQIPISILDRIAKAVGDRDLDLVERHPEIYSDVLDLDETKNVLKASRKAWRCLKKTVFFPPTMVIYSESAQTVDAPKLIALLKKRGLSKLEVVAEPKSEGLRHQMLLESGSARGSLFDSMTSFAVQNGSPEDPFCTDLN